MAIFKGALLLRDSCMSVYICYIHMVLLSERPIASINSKISQEMRTVH